MNPIQAAISKISNVARQKFGDNQGWVQNNRISAQPLKQSLYNAGRNVANTPITDIVPAFRNLRQTTQKYNPQAWQSVPTLKSMWQDPTSIPVFGGTYRTAKPIIDYLNPSGYGQDDFGKFKGAMKAMPATAVNLFGTSKLTGAGVVGAGVVGGAFNILTGGSFSQGAKAGMDMAPSLAGVGAFTNPLIAKGANLVGAKFANPIARQIASRVAVGVGNIPEGMLFRGAGGGGAYGIKDAATDFAIGTVAGSPVAHGIKDSRVKNLVDETKGLSDISDPVQNELYSEMRSAQTKVMDKIKLLRGKYKTDANIPRVIKKELDILKNDWQVKADQWESVYANKNKFDYTPATNLRPHEQEVENRFGSYLKTNFTKAVDDYTAKFGKELNTDNARELSGDYEANRAGLSRAVHEPASSFIKKVYEQKLTEVDPKGENVVLFTAGGTGAGKTSAIRDVDVVQQVKNDAQIIYDTNMNGFKSAKDKIDQALKAGKKVVIAYVHRDPVESLVGGALPRAKRIGRTVPMNEHINTHAGVQESIPQLMKEYHGNPLVGFMGVDNTRGKGGAIEAKIDNLVGMSYNRDELKQKLYEALNQEYQKGDVPDEIYSGFTGKLPPSKDITGNNGFHLQGDGQQPQSKLATVGNLPNAPPEVRRAELQPIENEVRDILEGADQQRAAYEADAGSLGNYATGRGRALLGRMKALYERHTQGNRQGDWMTFSATPAWKKNGPSVMEAYSEAGHDFADEAGAIEWLGTLPNKPTGSILNRTELDKIRELGRAQRQVDIDIKSEGKARLKSFKQSEIDQTAQDLALQGYDKNKLKTRGFTETVQKAEQTLTPVAKKVSGQYEVITNPESLAKAKAQIANNYDEARSRVFESKDWDADVAAIGQELMRIAQENKQWTEAVNIAETIAMKATKAGQGNQALSMWGRMTPEGMLQFATKTIRKANEEQSQITKGIKKVLRIAPTKLDERSASVIDYAMRLANKAKNEEDRVKFVRVAMDEIQSYIPYGISDLLDELRYNNMLSSPLTHVRNAWSNSIQVGLVRPAVLLMQGKPKAVAQYYKGVVTNVAPAVENAIKALSGKVPYKPLEIELKGKLRAKPKLGLYNIPTRLLEASDQLFTTLVRGGEMARGVSKQEADAIAEGLLFRASTHPKGQGQLLNAIDAVADSVGSLRSKGLGWFIPFIRTPMNVAKQWIEYSPAGLLTLPGAANKKEQLAKSLIGSVATLMGAKLAMEGKTTWSAPEDQKERKLFYDSGRKPYSVKIGDKWVPMQYTGTFAWAVGIPAALQYYQTQQRRALTEDQVEKITKGLLSLGGFWSQQTFVSGLGSFVNTMQGKDDYTVTKSLAYTASQINPMAGLQRYIANVIDPIFRKPTTFVQQLQSGVPIMTKNLPYYETSTGEPAKRNISDYIAPYAIKLANPEFEQPYLEKQKRIQENAYINAYTKEDKNIPQPLREKAEKMELDRKAQDGWNYYSAKLKEYNKTKDAKTGSSLYYGIKNSKRLTPEMKEDLLKELPTPKTKGKTKTTSAKTKVKKVKASKSKKAKIKKIKTPKLSAKLPKRKKIKIAKIKTNKFKSLQSPKFAKIKTRSSKNLT